MTDRFAKSDDQYARARRKEPEHPTAAESAPRLAAGVHRLDWAASGEVTVTTDRSLDSVTVIYKLGDTRVGKSVKSWHYDFSATVRSTETAPFVLRVEQDMGLEPVRTMDGVEGYVQARKPLTTITVTPQWSQIKIVRVDIGTRVRS